MSESNDPAGHYPTLTFRLETGLDVLDEWSRQASQVERNVINDVLFDVVSRTVFAHYPVVDDPAQPMEFLVLAKTGLAVKIQVHGLESFGITYIGPVSDAPGLDWLGEDAETAAFEWASRKR